MLASAGYINLYIGGGGTGFSDFFDVASLVMYRYCIDAIRRIGQNHCVGMPYPFLYSVFTVKSWMFSFEGLKRLLVCWFTKLELFSL
jgi:hypothetical protein